MEKDTVCLIKSDFYRIFGRKLPLYKILLYTITTSSRGQGWLLWFRLANCNNIFFSIIGRVLRRHYSNKYCLDIPKETRIGKGCYIGHGICVVINYQAIIGDNVNISSFVNIGTNEGKSPVIGNNVYIGPNVSIVGDVHIGNHVTIGAGAVVVKDVPDNATVAGVPAKVLNYDRPDKYIFNPC